MPGQLYHSPARIVAEMLIDAGFGIDGQGVLPNAVNVWPIYVGREPDRPDEIIKVSNTQGIAFGSTQIDGEYQEKQGIQVQVRSNSEENGFYKINSIALFFDRMKRVLTDITQIESQGTGTIEYMIHSVDRTSNVLYLGTDTPGGKRQLFTVNAIVTIRRCC